MLKNEKIPSDRIARKRRQARRDILASAQSIMNESGPEAVTLASVAGQLGMTTPSLYHYFPSKEALLRGLVTTLLDEEIEALLAAVAKQKSNSKVLGTLIRAFHAHYIDDLAAFRTVYCQTQMYASSGSNLDETTLREEINPRTRHLFDVLERRIAGETASKSERKKARQLAFSAWTSALGLMTMLGVADATDDPITHSETDLLRTMSSVFSRLP